MKNMRLSGKQRQQLQNALIDAFPTKSSLEQLLVFGLNNKNIDAIAGGKNLQEIVFNLIKVADAQGWFEDLIRVACQSNPGNERLHDVAQELMQNYLKTPSNPLPKNASPHPLGNNNEVALRPSKQYKRLRCLARASVFIISLLGSAAGFYVWQLPTKNIVVLVADFKGRDPDNYRVTNNIFDQLENSRQQYPDVKIQRLNQIVTKQEDARKEGEKHKATIVIWGEYGVTDTTVQLNPHFEVLRTPKCLPNIRCPYLTTPVSELKSFKLQTRVSNEMVYLSLVTIGLVRYTNNDWDKAITNFSDALGQVYPIKALEQSTVYLYRGNAYSDKKDYDRAIADFNQALKLNPNDAIAYNNRGNAYSDKKDYDRAIADYNQALKLDPKSACAYINRGNAYSDKKDYDRAIADYNQALKLDPSSALAYNNRGNTYSDKKDYEHAFAEYNQALKLDPSFALAYNNRGYTYLYKGDYEHAFADFNKAVQLNPNDANAYDSRCEAYRNSGDNDSAITDCNQALKLDPTITNSYYNRGLAYKNKGSLDLALKDLKKVLELNDKVELSQKARQHLQGLGTF